MPILKTIHPDNERNYKVTTLIHKSAAVEQMILSLKLASALDNCQDFCRNNQQFFRISLGNKIAWVFLLFKINMHFFPNKMFSNFLKCTLKNNNFLVSLFF